MTRSMKDDGVRVKADTRARVQWGLRKRKTVNKLSSIWSHLNLLPTTEMGCPSGKREKVNLLQWVPPKNPSSRTPKEKGRFLGTLLHGLCQSISCQYRIDITYGADYCIPLHNQHYSHRGQNSPQGTDTVHCYLLTSNRRPWLLQNIINETNCMHQ